MWRNYFQEKSWQSYREDSRWNRFRNLRRNPRKNLKWSLSMNPMKISSLFGWVNKIASSTSTLYVWVLHYEIVVLLKACVIPHSFRFVFNWNVAVARVRFYSWTAKEWNFRSGSTENWIKISFVGISLLLSHEPESALKFIPPSDRYREGNSFSAFILLSTRSDVVGAAGFCSLSGGQGKE